MLLERYGIPLVVATAFWFFIQKQNKFIQDELQKELVQLVRKEIGPIASFDVVQWAPGLPKTRSGKIMRRILRKIAESDMESIGDTSTLADPSVVDDLISNRPAN